MFATVKTLKVNKDIRLKWLTSFPLRHIVYEIPNLIYSKNNFWSNFTCLVVEFELLEPPLPIKIRRLVNFDGECNLYLRIY
jgi:hypothetical protein